jgi:hypothetical protein
MPFLHAELMPASSAQAILSEPTHDPPLRTFALLRAGRTGLETRV